MAGGRQQARDWSTDADEPESSFPLWVTFGSLVLALVLFFSATVPALQERAGLRHVDDRVERLRQLYESSLQAVPAAGQADAEPDFQGLLVAIDSLGLTPVELLDQMPEPLDAGDDR